MIDCKIEEDILYQEYENCVNNVKSSPFHKLMADEKIKHSMQVIGAGNAADLLASGADCQDGGVWRQPRPGD